jgi:transcriptional regulator with XRE-family HTH domain
MRNKKKLKKRAMLKAAIYVNFDRQAEFGEAVGLSEQAVSAVITGRRKLTRAEMARISQVLNTPLRLLFPEAETR